MNDCKKWHQKHFTLKHCECINSCWRFLFNCWFKDSLQSYWIILDFLSLSEYTCRIKQFIYVNICDLCIIMSTYLWSHTLYVNVCVITHILCQHVCDQADYVDISDHRIICQHMCDLTDDMSRCVWSHLLYVNICMITHICQFAYDHTDYMSTYAWSHRLYVYDLNEKCDILDFCLSVWIECSERLQQNSCDRFPSPSPTP